MTTMAATVDNSLAVERMLALLSTLFGAAGDAAGRHRTLRRDELHGGAADARDRHPHRARRRAAEVLGLVLRDVAMLTGLGIAVGLPGAYAIGRAAAGAALRAVAARSGVARPGRRGARRRGPGWPVTSRHAGRRRRSRCWRCAPSNCHRVGRRPRYNSEMSKVAFLSATLGVLMASSPGAAQTATPAPGIPLDVATRRAAIVSDLRYELSLHVPRDQKAAAHRLDDDPVHA